MANSHNTEFHIFYLKYVVFMIKSDLRGRFVLSI